MRTQKKRKTNKMNKWREEFCTTLRKTEFLSFLMTNHHKKKKKSFVNLGNGRIGFFDYTMNSSENYCQFIFF